MQVPEAAYVALGHSGGGMFNAFDRFTASL